ncbi:MAG: 30S ribosomal protein S8 [Puniceicoccaceae bacterium MED-G30]|jgi:small subunit ribosomal protein S8|nr:MAG: 30S ribosomal protein S8 [Puniceicoccaceae bacterium MED-G30]RPG84172.1 MAG: 30S ribosomal protein S8 [Coraliomargarita sp. TMED73]|tara:strand:- start:467 stop:865 length:399 start_codon:yes stop_codon:yes gene_type:complete
MAVHDTIGDFLTIIRNASSARKELAVTQHSKMRLALLKILKDEGYISGYSEGEDEKGRKTLHINFKYLGETPAITGIERHSTPGRRLYYGAREIPRVLGGLGVAILTTSKGVMRAREARENGVGGELVCKVW